jgi:hypothetical protein
MHNAWHDVLGSLLLIKGHPFTSKELFEFMFTEQTYNGRVEAITEDCVLILQKLLQAFVIACPRSLLNLPGIIVFHH